MDPDNDQTESAVQEMTSGRQKVIASGRRREVGRYERVHLQGVSP